MKILVTGGCGFVGRHLVNRLCEDRLNEITVVDNIFPGSGGLKADQWPKIFKNDRSNVRFIYQDCREFFKEDNSYYDKVFHLAAIVGGRMVIERDPLAVGVDLSIDAEFFYWVSKLKKKPGKIYYFSSSAAYPITLQTISNQKILNESMIDFNSGSLGVSDLTYGWSKLTGEFLAKNYHDIYKENIVCFRPFSGYGPDQDLSYPFPSIILRALKLNEDEPMTVWGSGQQSRDFIHIEDCVDLILNHSDEINNGDAINISTGIGTSFNEFAGYVLEQLGKKNEIINSSDKPEGVFFRVGDRSLQEKFNFYPKTTIKEGISEGITYLSNIYP